MKCQNLLILSIDDIAIKYIVHILFYEFILIFTNCIYFLERPLQQLIIEENDTNAILNSDTFFYMEFVNVQIL